MQRERAAPHENGPTIGETISDDRATSRPPPLLSPQTFVRVLCCASSDRYAAAAAAITLARRAGMSTRTCNEAGVIAGELSANAIQHARGGLLDVVVRAEGGLEITCRDAGPGIGAVDDVLAETAARWHERAAQDLHPDGYGTGLGAVQRLADDLAIESVAGAGTTIVATKLAQPRMEGQ